jgi:hypothetical protein
MWGEGGPRVLRSQGPASLPRLREKQFADGTPKVRKLSRMTAVF